MTVGLTGEIVREPTYIVSGVDAMLPSTAVAMMLAVPCDPPAVTRPVAGFTEMTLGAVLDQVRVWSSAFAGVIVAVSWSVCEGFKIVVGGVLIATLTTLTTPVAVVDAVLESANVAVIVEGPLPTAVWREGEGVVKESERFIFFSSSSSSSSEQKKSFKRKSTNLTKSPLAVVVM